MNEENLNRHALCKVIVAIDNDPNLGISVWRVLCLKCRNAHGGFKRYAFSELPCEECGAVWKLPVTTKALSCKDKLVTITARYPDLDSARNELNDTTTIQR